MTQKTQKKQKTQETIDKIQVGSLLGGADEALRTGNDKRLRQIIRKLNSVAMISDGNISEDVQDYASKTHGWFATRDIYRDLGITKDNEKRAVLAKLRRLVEEDVLERNERRNGVYRRRCNEKEIIKWWEATGEEYPIKFPFYLEKWIRIFPGSVIVVAGSPNAGKSAFMFNMVKLNIENHYINYANCEMDENESKSRIDFIPNIDREQWKEKLIMFEKSADFETVIESDMLNIVDYIPVHDEFYKVGKILDNIHDRLNKGVAVVGIQMGYGQRLGRGGAFGTEKPRLYVTLDNGRFRIVKAKCWKGQENPNGWEAEFRLYNGNEFRIIEPLHEPGTISDRDG